jgi:hypothetical protein
MQIARGHALLGRDAAERNSTERNSTERNSTERNSTERNSTERNSTPDGTESGAELGVRGRHGQCFATAPCRQPALARERQDERCAPVALQSTPAFTLEDAVAFSSNESH